MKNVITVTYAEVYDTEGYDGYIFDVRPDFQSVYNTLLDNNIDTEKFVKRVIKETVKAFGGKRALLNELGEDTDTPLSEFNDVIMDYAEDVCALYGKQFSSTNDEARAIDATLIGTTGYELGTVGYSNWCWAIYPKGGYPLARDLWEGNSFYDLELSSIVDDELVHEDILCGFYLPNFDEDLMKEVKLVFGVEDFVLFDNTEVAYSDLEKLSFKKEVRYVIDGE